VLSGTRRVRRFISRTGDAKACRQPFLAAVEELVDEILLDAIFVVGRLHALHVPESSGDLFPIGDAIIVPANESESAILRDNQRKRVTHGLA
jgi:hypothetical protein